MRIKLAERPRRVLHPSLERAPEEIRESFETWMASKCPREIPNKPEPRPIVQPAQTFAGHAIPKPYTPPPEN